MQLVEHGKANLDDPQILYEFCPEIEQKQVLDGKTQNLVPRQGDITLRMLLNQTTGFGYEFSNQRLVDYARAGGRGGAQKGDFNVFGADINEVMDHPLVNQPGTAFECGVNIDWVGIFIERFTKLTLSQYFRKYIFEPLGINNVDFYPNCHMREHMAAMYKRGSEGTTEERPHLLRRALEAATPEQQQQIHCSGGAGLFAQPSNYVKIIAALLNDGVSAATGNRILKSETVEAMWVEPDPPIPRLRASSWKSGEPTPG
ncbi:hypothetical protein LTR46_011294 [Exophiala xenobiotica]|nr:hypothetical protein LTR46_011294 [Exophiala xenobiotica]